MSESTTKLVYALLGIALAVAITALVLGALAFNDGQDSLSVTIEGREGDLSVWSANGKTLDRSTLASIVNEGTLALQGGDAGIVLKPVIPARFQKSLRTLETNPAPGVLGMFVSEEDQRLRTVNVDGALADILTLESTAIPGQEGHILIVGSNTTGVVQVGLSPNKMPLDAGVLGQVLVAGVDGQLEFETFLPGNLSGPVTSTDNAVPRFDGTDGDLLQDSGVLIDNSDNLSGVVNFDATGTVTLGPALLVFPAADGGVGDVLITDGAGNLSFSALGSGDVVGPAGALDEALARFDTSTGKLLQTSLVTVTNTGDMAGVVNLTATGTILLGAGSLQYPAVDGSGGEFLQTNGGGILSFAAAGDVIGPSAATDNAIARFDTISGQLLQNSGVSIDDSDNITGANIITANVLNATAGASVSGALLDMNNQLISNVPTPLGGLDAANKTYVDTLVTTTLGTLTPARVITLADMSTFGAGAVPYTAGAGPNGRGQLLATNAGVPLIIDSVTVVVTDRVLVNGQTNNVRNGVYNVIDTGAGGSPFELERSADFAEPTAFSTGFIIFLSQGTIWGGTQWILAQVVTVDTDPVVFIQTSGGSREAGTALSLFGNILNVDVDGITMQTSGDELSVIGAPSVKGQLWTFDTGNVAFGVGANTQVLTANSATGTGLEWVAPSALGTSPLTTKGDLFGFSTVDARIPIGANDFVLTANSAITEGVQWAASNPLTTKGDIFSRDLAGVARLPIGSDGQRLVADSGESTGLKWETAANPVLTIKGQLITFDTASAVLAIGTAGQVLSVNLAEATGLDWVEPDPLTTKGDILTYDTDAVRLAVAGNGTVLKANSATATGLEWATTAPALTVKGELLTFDTAETSFSVGNDGQVLSADAGETTGLNWVEPDPLTTKGDVMVFDTDATRLAVGTIGQVLQANPAVATGIEWVTISPPLTAKGQLLTFDTGPVPLTVGTNGQVLSANNAVGEGIEWVDASPTTTKGDLIVRDATTNVRLPVGANTQTLVANNAVTEGLEWLTRSAVYVELAGIQAAVGVADVAFNTVQFTTGTAITFAVNSMTFSAGVYMISHGILWDNFTVGATAEAETSFVDATPTQIPKTVSTRVLAGTSTLTGGSNSSVSCIVSFGVSTVVKVRVTVQAAGVGDILSTGSFFHAYSLF